MAQPASPDPAAALSALSGALETIKCRPMLIGGLAVVARGVPQISVDIDTVTQAEGLNLDRLWKALRDAGSEARVPDTEKSARGRQVLLLQHPASGMPRDLSLGWLTFEREAVERATPVDLNGASFPVGTPEDLVVLKAVAWRAAD